MNIWQLVLINLKLLFLAGGCANNLPEFFNTMTINHTSITNRTVFSLSEVILLCTFDQNSFWFNGKPFRTLPLPNFLKGNSELYGCYIGEWNKLMLQVEVCELNNTKEHTENIISENIFVEQDDTSTTLPNALKMKRVASQTTNFLLSRILNNGSIVKFVCASYNNPTENAVRLFKSTIIEIAKILKCPALYNERSLHLKYIHSSLNNLMIDFGYLICHACAKFECDNHKTNVILSSEKYVENVENQTLVQGDNTVVKCYVPFKLNLPVLWLKFEPTAYCDHKLSEIINQFNIEADIKNISGIELPSYVHHILTTESHFLTLKNVQPEEEGWYVCIMLTRNFSTVTSSFLKIQTRTPSTTLNGTLQKHKRFTKFEEFNIENDGNMKENRIRKGVVNRPEQTVDIYSQQHNSLAESDRPFLVEEGLPIFKKKKPLDDIAKPAGSFIELKCVAIGNPMPNITWTRNNTEIIRRIGTVKFTKWTLKMEDVITDDSGIYKCSACNKYGCIDDTCKVIVRDRLRSPPIQSDKFPQNQTVLVNGSATFECKTISDLEPFIFWVNYTRKNESIRKLEESVIANITQDFTELPRNQDQPYLLRLHNITHSDEGWYTCVAGNSIGISVASAYLSVLDKLPSREIHTILRSHPYLITVVVVFIVSVFTLGTLFIIYVLRKLKHEKLLKQRIQTVHQWTKRVIIYKPPSSEDDSCDLQIPIVKIEKKRTTFQTELSGCEYEFPSYEFPLDSDWEIPRSTLKLGSILGEGAFGRVVLATSTANKSINNNNNNNNNNNTNNNSTNKTEIVAVKMVKEEHTDTDMASLVREMEVMKIIGKHVNIINLLGCCSRPDGPLWVIVEYAPHGNLKDFLKKHCPLNNVQCSSSSIQRNSANFDEKLFLTEKNLISFAFQVARGMEYLASRRCIHRDLAARNVLVSEDYVMKIADFGLARDIQDTDYYRKNSNGRLPVKWMAPESLRDKFYDSKSDVWSYGVLLWEIMSYGEQPYAHLMSAEDLYSYLISGQRMEKPIRCSLNIYLLMRQCWHFDSSARPTFTELVEYLEKIFQLTANSPFEEYLDLSPPLLETPPSSSEEECEPSSLVHTSPLRNQCSSKLHESWN